MSRNKLLVVVFLQVSFLMSVVFGTFYAWAANDIDKFYIVVSITIAFVFCCLWLVLSRWMESRVSETCDVDVAEENDSACDSLYDTDEKAFCEADVDEKEMLNFSSSKSNSLVLLAFDVQGDLLLASKKYGVEMGIPVFGRYGFRVNPIKNMRERVSELRSITRRNKSIANQLIGNFPTALQVLSKPEVITFCCENKKMQSLCDGLVIVSTQLDDTAVYLQKMCVSLRLDELPKLVPNNPDGEDNDYAKLNYMLNEVEVRLLYLKALLDKLNHVSPSE